VLAVKNDSINDTCELICECEAGVCSNDTYDMSNSYNTSSISNNEHINIAQWNVRGWTEDNKYLRERILMKLKPEIISISETFKRNNDLIELDGYTWKGFNRTALHKRAKRGSGGIGLFIKNNLFDNWDVNVINKSYDGIMVTQLSHKHSGYIIVIVSCYLPPEGTIWGRNGATFYEHLLQQMYVHSNADAIYICGDFNSRIADKDDFVPGIDNVLHRTAVDVHSNVNKHGECLLEFLNDTKMCIVNGRITPQYDNCTCVKAQGKSVVDYFIVPYDVLNNCIELKVHTMQCLIDELELQHDIEDVKHIPDHSLLMLKVKVHSGTMKYDSVCHEGEDKYEVLMISHTCQNLIHYILGSILESYQITGCKIR
jgi:hypothetical protein